MNWYLDPGALAASYVTDTCGFTSQPWWVLTHPAKLRPMHLLQMYLHPPTQAHQVSVRYIWTDQANP